MAQKKLPSMQWYPGDWRKEPTVQALDYFDRGVWFELLIIMWDSPERGRLVLPNGAPMPDDAIARTLSLDLDVWRGVRTRLVDVYGTASEGPTEEQPDIRDGVMWSRRQVRDEDIRRARAEAGKKGGKASGRSRRQSSNSRTNAKQNASKTGSKGEANTEANENGRAPHGSAENSDPSRSKPEANPKQKLKQNRTSSSSSSVSSSESIYPPAYPPSTRKDAPDASVADPDDKLLAIALRDLGRGEFRSPKQRDQVRREVDELRRRITEPDDQLAALRGAAIARDRGEGPFERSKAYTPGILWRWGPVWVGSGEDRNERSLVEVCMAIARDRDTRLECAPEVPSLDLPDIPPATDPAAERKRADSLRTLRTLIENQSP